jgi:hypothetical protein
MRSLEEDFGDLSRTREDEALPLDGTKAVPPEVELPPDIREPLERLAGDYGWSINFVNEPDGSIHWFVFDRDKGALLKDGNAPTWDDARLAVIEDLYPPSGER